MPTAPHPEHDCHRDRTILVATDASQAGHDAIAWAASTFQAPGTQLHVVHVLEGRPHADPAAAAAALDVLRTQIERLPSQESTITCGVLDQSPAWESIAAEARRQRAELLIIGSRGHSTLPWRRLGTTARRLIRSAPCPVLAIPPDTVPNHGSLRGIVAVDFSEEASLAISAAVELLDLHGGGTLTLLHVCDLPSMPYEGMGYGPLQVTDELLARQQREAAHLLEGLASDAARANVHVDFATASGPAAIQIETYAASHGADFIAVGATGRSLMHRVFLGSVALHLLESHALPVLTSHAPAVGESVHLSSRPHEKVAG